MDIQGTQGVGKIGFGGRNTKHSQSVVRVEIGWSICWFGEPTIPQNARRGARGFCAAPAAIHLLATSRMYVVRAELLSSTALLLLVLRQTTTLILLHICKADEHSTVALTPTSRLTSPSLPSRPLPSICPYFRHPDALPFILIAAPVLGSLQMRRVNHVILLRETKEPGA